MAFHVDARFFFERLDQGVCSADFSHFNQALFVFTLRIVRWCRDGQLRE